MGADTFDREQLLRMLRASAGREDATFRPQQEEAIRSVLLRRAGCGPVHPFALALTG
jgi:hypothetical protein